MSAFLSDDTPESALPRGLYAVPSEPAASARSPEPRSAAPSARAPERPGSAAPSAGDTPSAPPTEVSRVTLSPAGKVLEESAQGDEELLAETVAFTHRLATLTARALGHAHCRAMYLRSPSAAIVVTQDEALRLTGQSGKIESLGEALSWVGLE